MEKQTVIEFFDRCAPWWDADMVRREDVIDTIFTLHGVGPGMDVLDVACGTGVLFPDYLKRQVRSLTGVDISPEMVRRAREKFPQAQVLCADVETADFGRTFDAVMVYNAFPHFPEPNVLLERLAELTRPGGRVSVAHGMSRRALQDHHRRACAVSVELPDERTLALMMERRFHVDVMISTDRMYMVSGIRRD